jgi:hypothetical protein
MNTPEALRDFHCEDYFASQWARGGYWDEPSQLMLVEPARKRVLRSEHNFLVIGGPGVDGIEFGYRRGRRGIWAHYPIDQRFLKVAKTTAGLIERWLDGSLSL